MYSLYHYSVSWEETEGGRVVEPECPSLSLGASSLNLLRLLRLGLIQPAGKVELLCGGKSLDFIQIISPNSGSTSHFGKK